MKAKGRPEWNTMPGYTRAERFLANHETEEAAFNSLEVGLDAKTIEEFLRGPIDKIEQKIAKEAEAGAGVGVTPDGEQQLLTLVMRFASVLVMAERERVEKEEAK